MHSIMFILAVLQFIVLHHAIVCRERLQIYVYIPGWGTGGLTWVSKRIVLKLFLTLSFILVATLVSSSFTSSRGRGLFRRQPSTR